MSTKDALFGKLTKKVLQDEGRYFTVLNEFADTSVDLKVDFAYDIIKLFGVFPKFVNTSTKSQKESLKYRNLGNLAYKLKNDLGALRYYTKSISFAPKDSEELALALNNRSAVLYRINNFYLSLVDINRALKENVPATVKSTLQRRKYDCITELRQESASTFRLAVSFY